MRFVSIVICVAYSVLRIDDVKMAGSFDKAPARVITVFFPTLAIGCLVEQSWINCIIAVVATIISVCIGKNWGKNMRGVIGAVNCFALHATQ